MSNDESPEERAQRSVERMFPLVARFLASDPGQLPVYGPTDPFGDEETTPDVIVRVDYLMSREQLTTVLGMAWAEIGADRDPESLSSIEVRHEVEAWLSVQAFFALSDQMERDRSRTASPEQQRVMQVLAEAIAKAYPPRREPEPQPVQRPEYGDGTVTLDTLDHGRITIDEPVWCTGHDGEQIVQRVDVTHVGVTVTGEYAGVEFLPARISWAPFAQLQPEPLPLADVDEFPGMAPDELRGLGAEVALHAGRLYSKANELDRIHRGMA